MRCRKFENDIALYAGGDLPAADAPRVEQHLAECEPCRALLADLRSQCELLRGADFSPRGASAPQRWKLAIAAAVILAVVLGWPRHHVEKIAPKPVPVVAAKVVPPPVVAVKHQTPHRRHRRPAVTQPAQPGEPLLVQFVTNDPNIVIYWIVDQKQGD